MSRPESRFVIEPLGKQHLKTGFACGRKALDIYLLKQAGQDIRRRIAQVFVLCSRDSEQIVGFYTLSAATIQAVSMPAALARKLPQYPLPAALLGRLAVDGKFQGQGLGKILQADALKHTLAASESIAIHAVIVDAKDTQAKAFYEKFGFLSFEDVALRLFLPLSTIQKLSGQ